MKMSGLDKIVFLTPNSQVQAVYGWQGGSPAKGCWGLSSPFSPSSLTLTPSKPRKLTLGCRDLAQAVQQNVSLLHLLRVGTVGAAFLWDHRESQHFPPFHSAIIMLILGTLSLSLYVWTMTTSASDITFPHQCPERGVGSSSQYVPPFFFRLSHAACGIFVPWPGTEPRPHSERIES